MGIPPNSWEVEKWVINTICGHRDFIQKKGGGNRYLAFILPDQFALSISQLEISMLNLRVDGIYCPNSKRDYICRYSIIMEILLNNLHILTPRQSQPHHWSCSPIHMPIKHHPYKFICYFWFCKNSNRPHVQ